VLVVARAFQNRKKRGICGGYLHAHAYRTL
jgi:hypothetical protein